LPLTRFKDKFFSNNIIKATIKEMILEEISKLDTSLEIIAEIGQTGLTVRGFVH